MCAWCRPAGSRGNVDLCSKSVGSRFYFISTCVAYLAGLILTVVVMHVFNAAQVGQLLLYHVERRYYHSVLSSLHCCILFLLVWVCLSHWQQSKEI